MAATDDPSQFYSGLIADLYEPLAGGLRSADEYIPFLDQSGSPALGLACGSGVPLLDRVERGYDVDGLDASQDMLETAGFDKITFVLPHGGRATPNAPVFVALARRGHPDNGLTYPLYLDVVRKDSSNGR